MADLQDRPTTNEPLSSEPLRVTSTVLNHLLQISPDALVIVDAAGTIALLNAQAEALFGYSLEELRGQRLEALLPERFRKAHTDHREHYFAAPRMRPMGVGLRLFGRRKDGVEFSVDISLRPFLLNNQPYAIAAIRDVTDQRRFEHERAQQLEHIRLQTELINQAHDAIIVRDPASRVLLWNRGAEELYGWTAQEALGRITHTLLKTHFPTSPAAIDAHLMREGQWEGELIHTRRDGSTVIVESRQALFRDEQGQPTAFLEINRDITERRSHEQAEQAVHIETTAHLTFLQQVLDALPNSVYIVYGHDARLVLANRAAARVWGAIWQPGQPMLEFLRTNGIRIFDVQGRPLPFGQLATLRAVRAGETVLQQEEMIRHPDGSSLPVLVSAVALTAQRLPQATQGGGQQEQTQQPLALAVHQDVTVLKEAEYLKVEFVGIAAHELRTPLAVLRGYADMLLVQTARRKGPKLTDWQNEALQEIQVATGRLTELTEQLLEVTRLQAGQLTLNRAPTDAVSLVRRIASQLQKTTSLHSVEVRTPSSPLVADIDPGRIEQVITNLIGNAIKYSPRGGPVIITIEELTDDEMVCIRVQDRGIGIPKHQHAQIFGRFMRADNARAWGINGTGLGLYLCRQLVELHGGQLWFESKEDAGSTFFMTLPLFSATPREDVT